MLFLFQEKNADLTILVESPEVRHIFALKINLNGDIFFNLALRIAKFKTALLFSETSERWHLKKMIKVDKRHLAFLCLH